MTTGPTGERGRSRSRSPEPRRAWWAALAAVAVGGSNAAVSAYWALGGTAALDTVGGQLEELARSRPPAAVAGLWVVVVAKLAGAVVGVALMRASDARARRLLSGFTWLAGGILAVYGGTLTVGQALVVIGVVPAAPDVDWTAVYGHFLLWDPWFLLWGLLLLYTAHRASPRRGPPATVGLRRGGDQP